MTEQGKIVFDELRRVLNLALIHHGTMLMSDPPQSSWKAYRIDEQALEVLKSADKLESEKQA